MILHMFSIHDHQVGAYMTPFFMRTMGEAARGFVNMAKDPSNQIGRTPKDFTLFYLGAYDDQKGTLVPPAAPEAVMTGVEAKSKED